MGNEKEMQKEGQGMKCDVGSGKMQGRMWVEGKLTE